MENLKTQQPGLEGAHVRRFQGRRGALITEETRHIGALKDPSGDSISVGTMILTIGIGTSCDASFGVALTLTRQSTLHDSAFLDFDELDEIISAFGSVCSFVTEPHQEPDCKRVKYATRDNVRFGVTKNATGMVIAWVGLRTSSDWFVPVELLANLRDLLLVAQRHLLSRGAK